MKLLLDTNVFLEVALAQAKAREAGRLLQSGASGLFITDLSLHSVGIHLFRRGLFREYDTLMADVFVPRSVKVVSLPVEGHPGIPAVALKFRLDFEDAYQFCVAEHFGLSLVSFDADFDRVVPKRLTPTEALEALQATG